MLPFKIQTTVEPGEQLLSFVEHVAITIGKLTIPPHYASKANPNIVPVLSTQHVVLNQFCSQCYTGIT